MGNKKSGEWVTNQVDEKKNEYYPSQKPLCPRKCSYDWVCPERRGGNEQ